MVLKIILTAIVVLAALLTLRQRARRVRQPAPSAPPRPKVAARLPHYAAYGVASILLAGALYFVYLDWVDNHQVVTVRVIDTRSGHTVRYEAYRGDVAERSLRTLDGRMVSLAEVERMEFARE